MYDDEFPDPDEEFDLVPAESFKKANNVAAISAKASQNGFTETSKSSVDGNSKFLRSNDDEFPDFDDEFDLIPTDADQQSKNLPSTSTQGESSKSINTQASKPISKTQAPNNDFPDPDEEFDFVETNQASTSTGESLTDKCRKRNYDELMKDVASLLRDDPSIVDSNHRREKKPRWDQPELIIEAILHQKKKVLERYDKDVDNPRFCNSNYLDDPQRESITTGVPSWNFVALTRPSDCQRLYIRVKPDAAMDPIKVKSSGLLSVSYDKLKADAEKILAEKAKERLVMSRGSKKKAEDVLWVDKYRPKKYLELLTDETTNREFLRWLKLWDKVVFNREIVPRKKNLPANNSFSSKKFSNNKFDRNSTKMGGFNAHKFGDNYDNVELVDKKGFPVHRIALLSGPPGLGKTTLAHLVAKHAGYNVVEINASDDRSPEAFRQALLSSTQMKSMIGADPRPNCLVLDEIDGAPAASIELLLKFVQGKLTEKGKKSKSAEKSNEYCKRPIVCICNELYTPALRPLRAAAYIIYVPRITPAALSDRLATIARKERLDVDQRTLLQLAEKSGCDVRSCVNALQYMGEDCDKSNLDLSLKDSKKGLFEFWKDMLQIPHDKTGPLSLRERVQKILKSAYSNNSDRFVQGVFENYPPNCHDNMNRISISLEWFQFYDEITTFVMIKNDWQVMPYTNYAFVSWHLGFALPKTPKLSFPYTSTEVNQKINKTMALVSAAQRACGLNSRVIILDLAPLSFELLTPRLRSVATNLYTPKEKSDLEHLIDIMLSLGLTFVQDKKEDGSMDYVIDPDLFEIGIFPDCKQRKGLSYTIKQIVAREVEIERLKRAAIASGITENSSEKKKATEAAKDVEFAKPDTINRPNHIDRMDRIALTDDPKDRKFRDFFKDFKLPPKAPDPTSPQQTSPKAERIDRRIKKIVTKNGVWFKYIEGYSNAVRRTVKIKDIL
ncbi:chromosome transmission fidelity protein 18 homolog isoform X2 [Microplitis mediator]|uniref:chromosome transmission fidelity protein 18 homolog isoform X2 n=1 Tax=Microplitis mediator TaxID=375433 RepID=UPI0025534F0A|nr:chromosome transmission fidelity protein 18 homolog isoform X2 [Microplitis mediator]